jgi:glycosyltransferase involved in cell wall biosynthesis
MRPIDRDRIHLCGAMERSELAALLNRSQIFYSPSAYESFGIAAAEALCCGCSVVGTQSLAMPAFEWFVSENSGTLGEDNVTSHVSALLIELKAWDESKRQPEQISSTWRERLHAPRLAQSIVNMKEQTVIFS